MTPAFGKPLISRSPRRGLIGMRLFGAVVLTARAAVAQAQTPDVHEIASALAAEQARIAELQAELDRRGAILADLARQLSEATAKPITVQNLEPSSPPSEKRPAAAEPAPRFQFYGETKVRYETLNQSFPGCVGCPNRDRGRLRLRFGMEGRLAPDFTAVMGFGVGDLNDPNTVYVN